MGPTLNWSHLEWMEHNPQPPSHFLSATQNPTLQMNIQFVKISHKPSLLSDECITMLMSQASDPSVRAHIC